MKKRNHLKKVLKTISIAILAVVLAFTNFAGLFPAKVYAATQVVTNEPEFRYAIMGEPSDDPDNPTVIQLSDDINISGDAGITVFGDKYVKLDLNGKRCSINCHIDVYGSLTVQGSGELNLLYSTTAPISITLGGEFTLSGGTIEGTSHNNWFKIEPGGSKFVMTGGEMIGAYEPPVIAGLDTTIEISGGTITSSGAAAISSDGTVSITGGTITNTNHNGSAVSVTSHGTVTVSGGTLQNTGGGYSLNIESGGQATQTGGTISGSINTNSHGTFNYEGGTNPEHSTITFVANGGSGTMDPQYVQNGVATALIANSFTRDSYSFDGWKDASGTSYADGATVNINSDMTLTAQWKDTSASTTYTITFDANGGTVSPTSGTTDASGKLSSLPTPTWSGHNFSGWFTTANGGTQVTTNTVFTGSDTIYAHWAGTPATYTITFDANGGTVSPTSGTTDASGKLSSLPVPTRKGYDFKGWFTAKSGGTRVNVSATFTANDTIYAHWEKSSSNDNKDDSSDNRVDDNSSNSSNNNNGDSRDYIDPLRSKLSTAISLGGNQTVTWDEGTALPYDIMKTLQDNPQITLVFSYVYKGTSYKITIPGSLARAYTNIPWYGPLYLFANFGGLNAPVATAPITTTQTYMVKPGETLSSIAVRLHTSVRHLVQENNIANPDYIRPGQILKY